MIVGAEETTHSTGSVDSQTLGLSETLAFVSSLLTQTDKLLDYTRDTTFRGTQYTIRYMLSNEKPCTDIVTISLLLGIGTLEPTQETTTRRERSRWSESQVIKFPTRSNMPWASTPSPSTLPP